MASVEAEMMLLTDDTLPAEFAADMRISKTVYFGSASNVKCADRVRIGSRSGKDVAKAGTTWRMRADVAELVLIVVVAEEDTISTMYSISISSPPPEVGRCWELVCGMDR